MPDQGAAWVLAFHGGGFLGYFSALVSDALQKRRSALGARGPLKDSFDAICGTSVGAIIASGVAIGLEPDEIVRLMREKGEGIFPLRRFGATWPGIFCARFSQKPLRGLLTSILGDVRLGELDRLLVIPAVNETSGVPVVFRSCDPAHWELRLIDVVLASAAAPLYFPLHRISGERYADGGLIANAPGLIASVDLTRLFGVPASAQRMSIPEQNGPTPRRDVPQLGHVACALARVLSR